MGTKKKYIRRRWCKVKTRKMTEVQGKCEITKKEGRAGVGRKGRLEHGKVRREKGGRQRNRTKRKRRAQDWKRRK